MAKFVIFSHEDNVQTFFLLFSYFFRHFFCLISTGTVDIEVAAKLALGTGKQLDLEQERLELQVCGLIFVDS